MRKKVLFITTIFLLSGVMFSGEIKSLVGKKAPNFLLETYDEKKITNRNFNGMYYAFIFEGRKGDNKNMHVRRRIQSFISMLPLLKRRKIAFFAVADVNGYVSFVKPMIRSKIKSNQIEQKVTILCDFEGHILKRFKMQEDFTNFVLVDNNGIIRFAYNGVVPYSYLEKVSRYLSKEFDADYTNAPIDISPNR